MLSAATAATTALGDNVLRYFVSFTLLLSAAGKKRKREKSKIVPALLRYGKRGVVFFIRLGFIIILLQKFPRDKKKEQASWGSKERGRKTEGNINDGIGRVILSLKNRGGRRRKKKLRHNYEYGCGLTQLLLQSAEKRGRKRRRGSDHPEGVKKYVFRKKIRDGTQVVLMS